MQPVDLERTGADQLQVGQHPGRRVGQDRQCGGAAVRGRRADPHDGWREAVPVRGQLQGQPMPGPDPHGDGTGAVRTPFGVQQDPRLGRPSVDGTPALPRHHPQRIRVGGGGARPIGPGPDPQLVGPARVPQVPVQVEPVPPVGMRVRMRMPVWAGLEAGAAPQREADPLAGVRPGGRSPDHEVHRVLALTPRGHVLVPCQGDGQPRAQQPVRSDPRKVPAQQVRSQMAEIGPDPGREVVAMRARHGTQIEIDVDACGGARPRPVPGGAAGGRSLDHGRRHGELAHAQPEGKAGIPIRGPSEHQHSPCADGTPNLPTD